MRKLLFFGELPPRTIHGVSISNDINIKFLKECFEVAIVEEYVDLEYHGRLNIRKFNNFIYSLLKVINLSLKNKFNFFYVVLSLSKVGILKTLFLILLFRIVSISSICVIHIHRGDLEYFVNKCKINWFSFWLVSKISHRFIVLSVKTKLYIQSEFNKKNQIFVIPNTINDEYDFNNNKRFVKENMEVKQFVYISNYIEEKGILLLLDTFKKLDNNFQLNCYGNFSDSKLKSKILSYQSKSIKINGPISGKKKYEVINDSYALILPSYNEGKPLVLLEAMMVGTPFITPNVGYIKEMVFEKYPFIYKKNTSENLFDMIIKFSLISLKERIILGESLKTHYFNNYSNLIHKNKILKAFH